MNNVSSYSSKDTIIIISIIIVFLAVFFVFYTEILKNQKIRNSKNNFDFVTKELFKEVNQCEEKKKSWLFGISCEQKPTKKIIIDYFNKTKKLTNPHDGYEGVGGGSGSVQVYIKNKLIFLSIDVDANGGIDINRSIRFD